MRPITETQRQQGDRHPDWQTVYDEVQVTDLPWHADGLCPSIVDMIQNESWSTRRALDIGCGVGHQADFLNSLGLEVTAIDVSQSAIKQAGQKFGHAVRFLQADILTFNCAASPPFEMGLDRGCYHVLAPADRPRYVEQVARLIEPGGILIIVCFASGSAGGDDDLASIGPHRFSSDDIAAQFAPFFALEQVVPTSFRHHPKPSSSAVVAANVGPETIACLLRRKLKEEH